jgi:hypothetical protein
MQVNQCEEKLLNVKNQREKPNAGPINLDAIMYN